METIYDVMSWMNELYLNCPLIREQYEDFKHVRDIIITEFYDYDVNRKEVCELLNLVDIMCRKFLTEEQPCYLDIINEFREVVFKLIEQKNKIKKIKNYPNLYIRINMFW